MSLYALQNPSDVGYDVYLLAGQSNMSGRGMAYDAVNFDPQSARIQQWAVSSPTSAIIAQLAQAFEPLGFPDSVPTGPIGMGPGLVFARWAQHATPDNRRILLVPAAYGGTGFSTTAPLCWDPATAGSLYFQAIAQANAAMAAAGPNARFCGILWVQGEYDKGMTQSAYSAKLDALIAGFRGSITGASASTPFVIGRITPGYVAANTGAPGIEAAHIDTPARNAYCSVAPGPSGMDDGLHYLAPGYRVLGRNLFAAFLTAKAATATQPTTIPTAISGYTATITGSGVALSWLPQGRTASYKVEQSTDGGTTWSTLAATSYGNTYTVALSSAGTYTFRVTGQNAAGMGAPASVTTTLAAPGQVTGLTSPSQTSTSIVLSWTAVTVGAQAVSYLVEYSTDGGTTWLTSSTTSATTATVIGLAGSTSYKFRVTAKSVGISGTASTVLTQSTGAPITVTDSYTSADSATSMGSVGTPLSSTWGIRSNTGYLAIDARGGSLPYNVFAYNTAPDGVVSLDLVGVQLDIGNLGLAFRVLDANNYYGLRLGGNVVQAYKIKAGALSSLGTFAFTHSGSGPFNLSVVKAGSAITVKGNGTTLSGLTITDTDFQAATKDGVWALATQANSSVDNFAFTG